MDYQWNTHQRDIPNEDGFIGLPASVSVDASAIGQTVVRALPCSQPNLGKNTCTKWPRSPELHTHTLKPLRRVPGRPRKFQKSRHLVEDVHLPVGGSVGSSIPDLNFPPPEAPLPELAEEIYRLCFEKTSPLWREVESMEIFRKTRQKPHFNNLASYRVGMREGKAIESMVTFLEVAKNASNLSVDTPKSRIKDDLEVLMDLGRSGFDVEFLRERLTQMLSFKEEEEMLRNQPNDRPWMNLIKNELGKAGNNLAEMQEEQLASLKILAERQEEWDAEIAFLLSANRKIAEDGKCRKGA